MSDYDDIDLSEAFAELEAPSSMANYASRRPRDDASDLAKRGGSRWPQALATGLAVLLALAGAGTFLALRSARQGSVASNSGAGVPPARSGAAMAFDSTAGLTVMYGGTGASGRPLHDTWLWNGSAWSEKTSPSNPVLTAGAHMTDDPADGGVLLVGLSELPVSFVIPNNGSAYCVAGSAGSGSVTPTSTSASAPPSAAGAPSGAAGSTPVASPPSSVTAPPSLPMVVGPVCPAVSATVQTWLYNGTDWQRVDSAAGAVMPPAGAELAYDAHSGAVLAVANEYVPCDAPFSATPGVQPDIACETPTGAASATGSAGSSVSSVCLASGCGMLAVPCPLSQSGARAVEPVCGSASVQTWRWFGGRWSPSSNTASAGVYGLVALFSDGVTGTSTLLTVTPLSVSCPVGFSCGSVANYTRWTWNGTRWSAPDSVMTAGPDLDGATVVGLSNVVVALTSSGQTWTWSGGAWERGSSAHTPGSRLGEAMAAGPGDIAILFGGTGVARNAVATIGTGRAVGSDTWIWHGGSWQQVGGTAPVPPTPCPATAAASKACFEILPAEVPTPAPTRALATAPAG